MTSHFSDIDRRQTPGHCHKYERPPRLVSTVESHRGPVIHSFKPHRVSSRYATRTTGNRRFTYAQSYGSYCAALNSSVPGLLVSACLRHLFFVLRCFNDL
jgi:hypothetical protein